jgi:hypothetical protein
MFTSKTMPEQVRCALDMLLKEFRTVDLEPRLVCFAEDNPEFGRLFAQAWDLVEGWRNDCEQTSATDMFAEMCEPAEVAQ